jgi:hypothetical protein
MPEPQLRTYAISTLAELEKAIAEAVDEACDAVAPGAEFREALARRIYVDACEVISAEADRIARPPYKTRRERQQEAKPA